MSNPHKCPICHGTGKLSKGPFPVHSTGMNINTYQVSCNSCNGSGIVWEPETVPAWPSFPPAFTPYQEPNIGLTWPENFKFPDDIVKNSKEELIKTLERWIEDLKKPEESEEPKK